MANFEALKFIQEINNNFRSSKRETVLVTRFNYEQTEGNISFATRIARAVTALVMLAYPTFTGESPIAFMALLPLIAIYPMYTAVVGWDPVAYVISAAQAQCKYQRLKLAARIMLFAIGAGLIGATMVIAVYRGELGNYSVLALAAILPIYSAIIEENPLTALRDSIADLQEKRGRMIVQFDAISVENGIDKSIQEVPESRRARSATIHSLHRKAA